MQRLRIRTRTGAGVAGLLLRWLCGVYYFCRLDDKWLWTAEADAAMAAGRLRMDIRKALTSQYLAALAMLEETIRRCPDDLWVDPQAKDQFWQIAYHALFFTHLYLQESEAAFRPWAKHRKDYHNLGPLPGMATACPRSASPTRRARCWSTWRSAVTRWRHGCARPTLPAPPALTGCRSISLSCKSIRSATCSTTWESWGRG